PGFCASQAQVRRNPHGRRCLHGNGRCSFQSGPHQRSDRQGRPRPLEGCPFGFARYRPRPGRPSERRRYQRRQALGHTLGQVRKRSLADNEAKAVTRSIRISPRKLNELATIIRGMKASKALAELTFSRRRIAKDVKKTLESAIANAENNHDLDINNLVVAEAWVGKNLVMKRFMPGARGRV